MHPLSALGIPPIRGHVPLAVALVVDSTAAGIAAPIFLLYLVDVAGTPVARAGTILAVASLLALAMPAVVLALISRWGPRFTLIWAQIVQGGAFGGLLLAVSQLWLLIAFVTLAAIGQRMFWSSVFPFIAEVTMPLSQPASSPRWFAFAGMLQATGMATGAAIIGGLLLLNGDTPFYVALAASSILFLVSAILLFLQGPVNSRVTADSTRPRSRIPIRDRPYLALTAINVIFAVCTVSLATGLPVYVTQALGLPRAIVAPILMLVTILNATCQGLIARLVQLRSAVRAIVLAAALWLLWGILMGLLVVSPDGARVPLLVLATVSFCGAQLLHAPISNSVAATAAPRGSRSEYLAFFQYSFAIAGVIAPALFGWLFAVGAATPYVTLAVLVGCAGIAMIKMRSSLSPRIFNSATTQSAHDAGGGAT